MKESSVAIIGSGNIAAFLARNFHKYGIRVDRIISRNAEKGKALAAETRALWSDDFSDPGSPDNIIVSAVKDSAASEVWKRLRIENRLLLHTAGTLSLNDLAPFAKERGVLYPLQSISSEKKLDSCQVPFLIEANSAVNLEKVRLLASRISEKVSEADSAVRGKLHLAAVFANNFSNLCFRIAWELAEKEGLDPKLLLPLIDESCAKLHTLSPAKAQTGPAVRWDTNVMTKHLALLENMPETAEVYKLLSSEIHRRKK